jgi:hypothetical protein
VPASTIAKIAAQSKRVRRLIYETHTPSPQIAKALRVPSNRVRKWAEGFDVIPDATLAVLNLAFDRWRCGWDAGDESYSELVARYAEAHGLPGFLRD